MRKLRKIISVLWLIIGISSFLLSLSKEAVALPSTQFTVSGQVENASIFTLSDLSGLPAQTTLTIGTDTYTGVSLWSLLNNIGITTDPLIKNDILRDYVVATGSDGYTVVFSLGEIDPNFGNQPDLIAYEQNGSLLSNSGFAQLIVPGDNKHGRWVSNLVSLEIFSVDDSLSSNNRSVSTQFTLSGQVNNPDIFTVNDLPGSLSAETASSFTGVKLWSLLNNAGIETDPKVKNDLLSKYVVATGSDGYKAVFSMGEIDPDFGGQPNLVAYATNNGDSLGADGFARIVVPGDVRAGRYVSNLVSLEVRGIVSEPGVMALFLMGLVALRWQSRWQRASAIW